MALTRSRLSQPVSLLGLVCLALAWLVPNKSLPWLSAWNEGVAWFSAALLALAAALTLWESGRRVNGSGLSWPMWGLVGIALTTVWIQWLTGTLVFRGDALLITLYLGFFALSAWAAGCLARDTATTNEWADALMGAAVVAGLVSTGMLLMQWTGASWLVVFVQESTVGTRPFANLGQSNNANTLCFLASCALLQLHSRRRVSTGVLWLGLLVLSLGMALTQSRTAVVQLLALVLWAAWQTRSLQLWRSPAVWLGALWAMWTALLPHLAVSALLATGRAMDAEGVRSDLRFVAWRAMMDAVSQRPWFGYGWLENGWAQKTVVGAHPGLRYEFNYAHNFVIDWFIWLGLPLGVCLLGLLSWWGWQHARSRNGAITWVMGAVLGVLMHGLLEYPLAYSYFLVPLGLLIGVIDAWDPVLPSLSVPRWLGGAAAVGLVLLLAGIGREYARAVEADTLLRTEALRIGVDGKTTPPPRFALLDQLGAQFEFRFIDPKPGMTPEQLALMERVVRRYANYAVLTDYAYAKGLNGDPAAREEYLNIVCAIYGEARCVRDMDEWAELRQSTGGRLDIYMGQKARASASR